MLLAADLKKIGLGVELTGISDPNGVAIYVTVHATPNPLDATANLRAPLVLVDGRGYQVINANEDAPLRAPLFTLAGEPASSAAPSS